MRRLGSFRHVLFCLITVAMSQLAVGQTFTVLHTFTGQADGGIPYGSVTPDRAGHLYGTASAGGLKLNSCAPEGCGTAFRLTHERSGWIFTVLYTFQGNARGTADGSAPYAGVTIGPNGSLYGTTTAGGEYGAGTVFNLQPPAHTANNTLGAWIETRIYHFKELSDGGFPGYGNVIFDQSGNIYGTTFQGGSDCAGYWCGTVFKLTPSGNGRWTEIAYAFPGRSYGGNPLSGVVMDASGNLYGTTTNNNYAPVAYELTPSGSGWTETVLYTFPFDENYPGNEGVILDGAGGLFGDNLSAVYQLSSSDGQWNYSVLYSFSGDGGPWSGLTSDASDNLYGTTCAEGAFGNGSVFKLTPSQNGWIETDLYDFRGRDDGSCPVGGVALDSAGNIYGTTAWGGGSDSGVVWEITP